MSASFLAFICQITNIINLKLPQKQFVHDQELLKKLQIGDDSAFRELFELYHAMVFNVCYRMLGSRHEGEDITQDVFVNAYKTLKHFRSESKLSTWLYRIAVNHCLNHQARKKRQRWISLDIFSDTENEQLSGNTTDDRPDIAMERKETEQIIQHAINSLPKQQRIALILHRYEGLSYQEIAKVLECSVSSIESRIFRGKQNLCKKLLPYLKNL